jgi:predicted glycogen debranching enzyme
VDESGLRSTPVVEWGTEALAARGLDLEWLEPDGHGGYAAGTAAGIRTRRYHALLLAPRGGVGEPMALLNGVEAWLETSAGTIPLSSQMYGSGVVFHDVRPRLATFRSEPWPAWRLRLPGGGSILHEVLVEPGAAVTLLSWRPDAIPAAATLAVRPLLSGRDMHATHHENPFFRFDSRVDGPCVAWRPYHDVDGIVALRGGSWEASPDWYRDFLYLRERERGLDDREDLATPGVFRFDLARGEALLAFAVEGRDATLREAVAASTDGRSAVGILAAGMRDRERARRAGFGSRLRRAADAYLVDRGDRPGIVAGYPWFGEWGRDTFVSLRGLCLATGRFDTARHLLLAWAERISDGLLPNRLAGGVPEYNSVDAALWFAVAAHETIALAAASGAPLAAADRTRLEAAVDAIIAGYRRGTRHGICCDDDGLVSAGEPGVQLTWMDAKVGDRVVTPRIGKPVEVQALWLNVLAGAAERDPGCAGLLGRGRSSFVARFWDARRGFLADVVDADRVPGSVDATFRPNQVLAVGGLPLVLLDPPRARRVVDEVERRLWTPFGLRSLAPGESGYRARYEGGVAERDSAYHQGTAWPWLAGPFVEAWVRVRGATAAARAEARRRFLEPLLARLDVAGLGHLPEIADAEPPYAPRGCPFQAWSVGEALRLDALLLAEPGAPASGAPPAVAT